jgi:hypothetical protein
MATAQIAWSARTTDLQVTTGQAILMGLTVAETTGIAGAVVRIRDGTSAAGGVVEVVRLAPGESARDWYGPQGRRITNGIYLEVVSGSVEGVVALA